MLKKFLIAMIAMLVIGLLVILVRESRSVSAEFYIDYSNYVSTLRQSQRDHETLIDTLQVTAREVQAVPETVSTLAGRLGQGVETLRAPSQNIRDSEVMQHSRGYVQAVQRILANLELFAEDQNRLARAAGVLRDDGPAVVRQLRDRGATDVAQRLFAVTVDALDVAAGGTNANLEDLKARIDALAETAAQSTRAPAGFAGLMDAASAVLSAQVGARTALEEINAAPYPAVAQSLYSAVAANNAEVTSRADRARLLLAAVCVLLILGIGLIGVRLRQSNQRLNDINAELEQFNVSLEERVTERTRELSSAYSELKESQAQLVQAEKMSSLGELVAGISHEINTPLWYLLSNTSLIKERLGSFNRFVDVTNDMLELLRGGGGDKEEFIRQLRRLDHALNHDGMRDDLTECNDLLDDSVEGLEQLSEMAQSLKDFSRLDRAATDSVNLNDGIDKTLVIAKNVLKGGVEIVKDYGELPNVSCSPSQINQVLLNLIKNAADAMDRTGVLTLKTRADERHAFISVIDTGSGIDADTLAKIRDPFFTTKEVGKGTGLGLSISQKIVDAHKGRLDIESTPGEGSTFTLVLPIGDGEAKSDMAKELEELEALSAAIESGDVEAANGLAENLDFPAEQAG